MQILGAGFRETIRQSLQEDRAVVVVLSLVCSRPRIDPRACCYGERSDEVGRPARRRDEVSEAIMRLSRRLALLLAQLVQYGNLLGPFCIEDDDVVATRFCREEPVDRSR